MQRTTGLLRQKLSSIDDCSPVFLRGQAACVPVNSLLCGTCVTEGGSNLAGRTVLISVRDQLAAALALIDLDGLVGRVIVCPPDLPSESLRTLISIGEVETIVRDTASPEESGPGVASHAICGFEIVPGTRDRTAARQTEWVLLTSGTSGVPKMAVHTLDSMTAAIEGDPKPGVVWGTFYDIRRYGGLQVLLRALLGRASLILSGPDEPVGDFLLRLGSHGATHISGTPSHWRRVLMNPHARAIAPRYIRLSGEIVDQGILDALKDFYPQAAISHAYASTEAGVVFEVKDGLEGFPPSAVGCLGDVEVRIDRDSLRVRSPGAACRLIGGEETWRDAEGFVDTGDLVELRGERYYFLGRRNGIINIGGLKVHPEEVEAVINRHPAVHASRVRARRNSITGSLVEAEVVLAGTDVEARSTSDEYRREILQICRKSLASHKVPASLRFVTSLELTTAGKLRRNDA